MQVTPLLAPFTDETKEIPFVDALLPNKVLESPPKKKKAGGKKMTKGQKQKLILIALRIPPGREQSFGQTDIQRNLEDQFQRQNSAQQDYLATPCLTAKKGSFEA